MNSAINRVAVCFAVFAASLCFALTAQADFGEHEDNPCEGVLYDRVIIIPVGSAGSLRISFASSNTCVQVSLIDDAYTHQLINHADIALVLHLSVHARPALLTVDGMYISFIVADDDMMATFNGEKRDLVELWREIAEWNPLFRIAERRDWGHLQELNDRR